MLYPIRLNFTTSSVIDGQELQFTCLFGHLIFFVLEHESTKKSCVMDLYEGRLYQIPNKAGLHQAMLCWVREKDDHKIGLEHLPVRATATRRFENLLMAMVETVASDGHWMQEMAPYRKKKALAMRLKRRMPRGWYDTETPVNSSIFDQPERCLGELLCRIAWQWQIKESENVLGLTESCFDPVQEMLSRWARQLTMQS